MEEPYGKGPVPHPALSHVPVGTTWSFSVDGPSVHRSESVAGEVGGTYRRVSLEQFRVSRRWQRESFARPDASL